MKHASMMRGKTFSGRVSGAAAIALAIVASGCEVDSFFDQSKTGRFEFEPTTIPVLDRLDVIEPQQAYWSNATPPTLEDIMPRELTYYLYPGDIVTVSIFELTVANVWDTRPRRVDPAGYVRIPELGDVRAAGLTSQQFQDEIRRILRDRGVVNPQVDVFVEQPTGLRYTVSGFVQRTGQYGLDNPNHRLVDALATAGGVPTTTERVYITRQIVLMPEVQPSFQRGTPSSDQPSTQPQPDVNIDDLLKQLENEPQPNSTTPPASPSTQPQPDATTSQPQVNPGMMQDAPSQPPQAPVDIDDLEPVRTPQEPPVDVDAVQPAAPRLPQQDVPVYDPQRGEWIRMPSNGNGRSGNGNGAPSATRPSSAPVDVAALSRVVEVDYQALIRGDQTQNVVIRPNDQIYVEGPHQGFVYIEGEIGRPGVYGMPSSGTLTLSRAVAAAGGFGAIAEPTRVDLTRKIGRNHEATIRLDLAAIRQRTEPDIALRPDDHIIIGTSFWATPVAIFRNGFRMTYGFGFLLDRNFGNDVFGNPGFNGF